MEINLYEDGERSYALVSLTQIYQLGIEAFISNESRRDGEKVYLRADNPYDRDFCLFRHAMAEHGITLDIHEMSLPTLNLFGKVASLSPFNLYTDGCRTSPAVRTAEIRIGEEDGDWLQEIEAYLPANYWVVGRVTDTAGDKSRHGTPTLEGAHGDDRRCFVEGIDHAGWKLDSYVIPRLGSGGIYATEL